MQWGAPAYLWLALLALPLALLVVRESARRRREAALVTGEASSADQWPSRRRRGLLLLAGALLLVASLCAPRWGEVAEERTSRGADIVILLDTSRSMLADDLRPSRLAAAKVAVTRLVQALEGDRIGLVAFAGSAFQVCPLTTDYSAFTATLAEAGADIIPRRGTSLAAALREGARAFPAGAGAKVAIVVSDGEDQEGAFAAAAQELRRQGVTVYGVAAGTRAGALIPLVRGEFFKDRQGAVVKTALQDAPLQAIAAGRVVDLARSGPSVLAELYRREISGLERVQHTSRRRTLQERFQVPLAAALALLSLELLLAGRRRS